MLLVRIFSALGALYFSKNLFRKRSAKIRGFFIPAIFFFKEFSSFSRGTVHYCCGGMTKVEACFRFAKTKTKLFEELLQCTDFQTENYTKVRSNCEIAVLAIRLHPFQRAIASQKIQRFIGVRCGKSCGDQASVAKLFPNQSLKSTSPGSKSHKIGWPWPLHTTKANPISDFMN